MDIILRRRSIRKYKQRKYGKKPPADRFLPERIHYDSW